MGLFRKKRLDSETMENGAKLITLANPQSVISEQFRNIRTNINFMNVDKEVKDDCLYFSHGQCRQVNGQCQCGNHHGTSRQEDDFNRCRFA